VLTGLHAHSAPVHDLLDALGVREELGLTTDAAAAVRAKVGSNTLPTPPRRSAIAQFVDQLVNPLVLTLIVAAFVAGIVGASSGGEAGTLERYGDAIAIVLIVTLNAFLGFFQERRAEAALDALQKIAAPSARVMRDGKISVIAAAEVVPGDVVELESGDAIPADLRLIHTMDLSIEEAALTGESVPVTKDARAHCLATTPLAERVTMAFLGTHVSRGRGRGVVTSTGANTELGRIGAMIAHVSTDDTPLAQRLKVFGQRVLFGCIALSVVLFAWGLIRPAVVRGAEDRPWTLLLLEAVSLAVAAIPEGLPAITTITLALGMQRMAKLGAIVRKLPAVETLGAATVICTDKTGTLTQNQMVARRVWAAREHFTVEGDGYSPQGSVLRESGEKVERGAVPAPLTALLETAALCNDAHIRRDEKTNQ
jgi:Ca2+-transporting ATPase